MLCSKQGGKTSQKELRTLKAVLSPALASLYESEVLPLLNYILLKVRLRDAEGKVIETRHAIRRTETYLANAVADEQRARAGSKKADRAAHLVEKHTNVLRKHESAASRAEDTVARTRAAFEREQGAVALSTLFDPFDDVSEHVVGAGGSGATEQGTPTARDRGDADDEDVSDAVFPSAKKARTASSPHVSPCRHTTTTTPTPPCLLPLERTDVMTCILAYLSCGDALNGLGMASRAARAAVMGAATSVSIRQGDPCTVLRGFPLLQHLTVLPLSTPTARRDWWRVHSTAWHAELTRQLAHRLVTLDLPLQPASVYDNDVDVASPLCGVEWTHLRHLHVTGKVLPLLRAMAKAQEKPVFPSLEAVGCHTWQRTESTALDGAIKAGCLPRFHSLDCLGVEKASAHPYTTEVCLHGRDVTPQLNILKAARSTRRMRLSFSGMYTMAGDAEGAWRATLPLVLDVLRDVRFPELRHLSLGAPLEVVRRVLECLVEAGIATHLHSLDLTLPGITEPPLPPQHHADTDTHSHTNPSPTWLLPPDSFPALTSVHIDGACTHEGMVGVLGACGTRLQSIHLHGHALSTADHVSALHTLLCDGVGGNMTTNGAGATNGDGGYTVLCGAIGGNMTTNGAGATNGMGPPQRPLWAASVTHVKLTVPDAKVVLDAPLALNVKDVVMALPSLQQLTLSCARDGAVVGVLEAKHAGALKRLRQLDFGDARRWGVVDPLSNGAGLLLLAWLKKHRNGLAKGLKVAQFWGDPARRELVTATGLSSCWIPQKMLR